VKTSTRIALVALAMGSAQATAALPPSGMMANVYRLTEAAAVLTVCVESPSFGELPADKALQLRELLSRLGALVDSIGRHYGDETMPATFEATRGRIAGEAAMRGYVKAKYQYCGDALLVDMSEYVETNEKLIGGYFARQAGTPRSGKR
jgi:hypothetical protein